MTPKQQRTTVGLVTAAFVSLLLVSVLGQPEPARATPAPSPQAVQDAFRVIERHIEPLPLPPTTKVSITKPVVTRTPTACPCPRRSYGPLRGGGWWQAGPARRIVSAVFRRRR